MNKTAIISAWKNAGFRSTLSGAELAALPQNPAGVREIGEAELQNVAGAAAEPGHCGLICTLTYDCAESYLAKKACDIWHVGS